MSSRPFDRGSIVVDRYRIVSALGRGASGRVYLADDLQLGRRVALKVLHEVLAEDRAFLKRFEAEVRSAASLNHPNVMHVYDSGNDLSDDGTPVPFLVMEFVGGGSLRAVLDSGPTFSPSQALVVGLDAARGLEYAHLHGFVHRDIKPANLLFGEEGRLRIADFGVARALAEATWTEPEGVLLGTAKYSAPEQAMGRSVDGRSDVYSLALVLVEAATGSVPFARDTTSATLMARTEHDLQVPRSLGRLAPVLERAGRLDPALRPDAGELVIAFLAASEDMDRPEPVRLPGAVPVHALEALVADAADGPTDTTAEAPTSDSADAVDITLIAAADATEVTPLPLTRTVTVPAAAAASAGSIGTIATVTATPASSAGRIDIPLDDSGPASTNGWSDDGDHDGDGVGGSRRRWPWVVASLLVIGALLGGGAYWWFEIRVPTQTVADVRGDSVDKATAKLEALGFEVTSTPVRRDGTDPDEVVSITPKAGTELAEGRTVALAVSLGNTLTTPPALVSTMDEATVDAALTTAALKVGKRSTQYDENVPKGFLVSWAPTVTADAGGQIPKQTKVDLVFSDGPEPRTVPGGLVGQPIEAVLQQAAGLKLLVNVTEEFSDEAIGTVLRVAQAEGATVPRDSALDVVTSKGPELFAIPDVIGRSGFDASQILRDNGFGIAGVTGSPLAPVVGVAPTVGQMVPKGTPVQILTNG